LRYSQLVARAKWILPLIAALPILIMAVWPYLSNGFARITENIPRFDASQIADLRMVNPRYAGTDRENHPFTVTAATAFQTKGNDDLMALAQPQARFLSPSGAWVDISSDTGLYQNQVHFLDLSGNVTVNHAKGYVFHTRSARVDLQSGSAEGNDPVTGAGPSGAVRSDGFRALHNGESVIFTGHAELTLTPAGPDRP
jgi:lipopolysaccharide export system protein LptC